VANPVALLLAAALMLDHVGMQDRAGRLRSALSTVLVTDNVRTRDLGGTASTGEITAAILRRL
jgi:isocitrate dehydrogenase (NAD+)